MAVLVSLLLPPVAPLITMLMLGNMLREVLIVERLAKTVANDLMNVITLVLTDRDWLDHGGRQAS